MSHMTKFRAVVKREYVQRVRSRMFVIVTVCAPLMFALFTVVPILIAGIKAGGPTRLGLVDETGRMSARVRDALRNTQAARGDDDEEAPEAAAGAMNQNSRARMEQMAKAAAPSYEVEEVSEGGRTLDEVKAQLDERVKRNELDGYLILPQNVLDGGEAEYHTRNVGDVFTMGQVKNALTRAVRDARLDARGVGPEVMRAVNQPVNMKATKARPQIANCVSATRETPTSLPDISVNGRTEEKRISAIRVSFSSMTAPSTTCPYRRIVR